MRPHHFGGGAFITLASLTILEVNDKQTTVNMNQYELRTRYDYEE